MPTCIYNYQRPEPKFCYKTMPKHRQRPYVTMIDRSHTLTPTQRYTLHFLHISPLTGDCGNVHMYSPSPPVHLSSSSSSSSSSSVCLYPSIKVYISQPSPPSQLAPLFVLTVPDISHVLHLVWRMLTSCRRLRRGRNTRASSRRDASAALNRPLSAVYSAWRLSVSRGRSLAALLVGDGELFSSHRELNSLCKRDFSLSVCVCVSGCLFNTSLGLDCKWSRYTHTALIAS